MALSLRYRRAMEMSRVVPLLYSDDCYQHPGKILKALSRMPVPSARKPLIKWILEGGYHAHRSSTVAEVSYVPAAETDLLSFIKASLEEDEGTYHCWLNRFDTNKLSRGNGNFLVLAARIFNNEIMFDKLKTLELKFPHICILGLQAINSLADQVQLVHLLMTENITVPILLSKKTFPEMEKGTCYIIFKNFRSPLIYHEKDLDLKVLNEALKERHMQLSGDSNLINKLSCPSWKQVGNSREQFVYSSLQNLLLCYPACISADEGGDRLFISDCNHHRILVSNGNGEILDCYVDMASNNGSSCSKIGSSPGFDDGDFGSAKLRRPAGSYYHEEEDCLYFVDAENHAIRRADMGARLVETLYPTSASNKRTVSLWTWIMDKLGLECNRGGKVDEGERFEVFDSESLYFPWHLLKSADDILFIMDRRLQNLWTFDLASGKISGVFEDSHENFEICRMQIRENLSLLGQVPHHLFIWQNENAYSLKGVAHSGLLSSITTLQNHIIICETVGQRILKINKESGACSSLQFTNLGVLGLPYWLTSPLETFYAVENRLSGAPLDHMQHLELLPESSLEILLLQGLPTGGAVPKPLLPSLAYLHTINIAMPQRKPILINWLWSWRTFLQHVTGRVELQLNVDIPVDTELVEPLEEACIWRQARGAASEVSATEDVPGFLDKVSVAQQWYDELDFLASPKPESEVAVEDEKLDENLLVQDNKVHITCSVNTSPGTSEVIIYAVMYLRLKRDLKSVEDDQGKYAGRILDIMGGRRHGKTERDLWNAFMLKSKGNLRDLIFMKPLHIRIKMDCLDHPKAENGRDIIVTDSSIQINVSLN